MRVNELVTYCNELLRVREYKDYCPNGLQVEGRDTVQRIVGGVTASKALIDRAIEKNADAILVHHGYFWKSESATITGVKRERIASLLKNDVNLIAYHLPLDGHNELGNNAQLGRVLGLQMCEPVSSDSLLWRGTLVKALTAIELQQLLEQRLNRKPFYISAAGRAIKNIMWCTGGAQSYFEQATNYGVDAYITGEVSEQNFHHAHETHVDFIAAGHHATERYGVQALGAHLAANLDVEFEFVDIENPV